MIIALRTGRRKRAKKEEPKLLPFYFLYSLYSTKPRLNINRPSAKKIIIHNKVKAVILLNAISMAMLGIINIKIGKTNIKANVSLFKKFFIFVIF